MTGGAPSEARRRALHFASGSLGLAALFLRNPHPMLTIVLVSLLAVAVLLEVVRRYSPALETALERLSSPNQLAERLTLVSYRPWVRIALPALIGTYAIWIASVL